MSNASNIIINKNRGLIFGILGAGILSVFLILLSMKYSTVITLILGILHFFFVSLLLLIFAQKVDNARTKQLDEHENKEDFENESADTKPIKDENAKQKTRFDFLGKVEEILYSSGLVFVSACVIIIQSLILLQFSPASEIIKPPIWIGVAEILLSFAYLMMTHWMFSKSDESSEYEVYALVSRCAQISVFIGGAATILSALGFNQLDLIFTYVLGIFSLVVFLDFLISGIIKIVKKESDDLSTIKLNILKVIFGKRNSDKSIIDAIEERVGVSLRSSWTIKFVRKTIPIIVLAIILIFWGMTAFVEIGPQREGIVYRFGKIISEEPLSPGLHVKLPWPIDKVGTYPVYQTQSFNVGYEMGEKSDYLWTSVHGGEEYKLLLGDGKELVSINMTVHYRVSDLIDFAMSSSNPAQILQAKAYEKMMKLIVSSDLDTLLSEDRAMLANTLMLQLIEVSEEENYGIEVLDVAITSIHPPVEVAANYQELVSAEIQKEIIISQAMMQKEIDIPSAEQTKDRTISNAMIDYEQRHSEAVSETIQIMSNKEAYDYSPDAYKTRIWRDAFVEYISARKYYIIDQTIIDGEGEIWMDSYE